MILSLSLLIGSVALIAIMSIVMKKSDSPMFLLPLLSFAFAAMFIPGSIMALCGYKSVIFTACPYNEYLLPLYNGVAMLIYELAVDLLLFGVFMIAFLISEKKWKGEPDND